MNSQIALNSTTPAPSISGSVSNTGDITSNLTLSYKSLNSTAYEVFLNRGQDLAPGNYSITVCPGQRDNNSDLLSVRQCDLALLIVLGERASIILTNLDYAIIGVMIIAAVTFVSITYVLRWRKAS
jgi:hypothetical protein